MLPELCETRKEAMSRAIAMKRRMLKPGQWKTIVRFNAGWYYCLHGPNAVSINPSREDGKELYYCLIGYPGNAAGGGAGIWAETNAQRFESPQKAFEYTRDRVAGVCDNYTRHARGLRKMK